MNVVKEVVETDDGGLEDNGVEDRVEDDGVENGVENWVDGSGVVVGVYEEEIPELSVTHVKSAISQFVTVKVEETPSKPILAVVSWHWKEPVAPGGELQEVVETEAVYPFSWNSSVIPT